MSKVIKAALGAAIVTLPFIPPASAQETVTVTASPIGGSADRFATIVGVVDRDEIEKRGGANLADALAGVPGVTGTNFAAGASRPVIRGFDANRVRVMEDGIGSFDVSDVGPDHGVPIDPLSAQSIEVVRGAATLRYGSQAIGGVVNAINNRVPTKLPDEAFSGAGSIAYGMNANTRQGELQADARAGQFAFHADGFGRVTDDYDTPLGVMPNSFFTGNGLSLGSSYFFGGSRVGAGVTNYNAQYGIPGEDTYISMKQTKFMTRSSFDIGAGAFKTLNLDGGYADYAHSEIDPTAGSVESTFKDREWDSRAEAVFGAFGPFSAAALGAQLQEKNFSALGEGADYLLPTTTRSYAGFGFAEAPLGPRVHLQTGARAEMIEADGTPASGFATSRGFVPISGAIGALWDTTDVLKLGLTVSSTARAPAQTELYARGAHDGPGTFETGDPSLKMERANSLEGTVRLNLNKVQLQGAVWSSWFDHFIYGQLTGNTCDDTGACAPGPGGDLKELFYRQQGAHFWGLEGKADIQLWEPGNGTLEANFIGDMVRATLNDGTNAPRVPPWHFGGGLSWTSARADAGFMVNYTGAQDRPGVGDTPTDGFFSLDAQASVRPFDDHPSVELAVIGKNLNDSIQRNAIAFNKDEVVLPGREIRVVLRTKF